MKGGLYIEGKSRQGWTSQESEKEDKYSLSKKVYKKTHVPKLKEHEKRVAHAQAPYCIWKEQKDKS